MLSSDRQKVDPYPKRRIGRARAADDGQKALGLEIVVDQKAPGRPCADHLAHVAQGAGQIQNVDHRQDNRPR